jgi:hypothetical protein
MVNFTASSEQYDKPKMFFIGQTINNKTLYVKSIIPSGPENVAKPFRQVFLNSFDGHEEFYVITNDTEQLATFRESLDLKKSLFISGVCESVNNLYQSHGFPIQFSAHALDVIIINKSED